VLDTPRANGGVDQLAIENKAVGCHFAVRESRRRIAAGAHLRSRVRQKPAKAVCQRIMAWLTSRSRTAT
jgi:hypothetical protein